MKTWISSLPPRYHKDLGKLSGGNKRILRLEEEEVHMCTTNIHYSTVICICEVTFETVQFLWTVVPTMRMRFAFFCISALVWSSASVSNDPSSSVSKGGFVNFHFTIQMTLIISWSTVFEIKQTNKQTNDSHSFASVKRKYDFSFRQRWNPSETIQVVKPSLSTRNDVFLLVKRSCWAKSKSYPMKQKMN